MRRLLRGRREKPGDKATCVIELMFADVSVLKRCSLWVIFLFSFIQTLTKLLPLLEAFPSKQPLEILVVCVCVRVWGGKW